MASLVMRRLACGAMRSTAPVPSLVGACMKRRAPLPALASWQPWARPCSGTSTEAKAQEGEANVQESKEPVIVFEGAKNQVVQTLKKVSVANLGFAIASTPILHYITAQMGSPGKGTAMSALLLFFGGGTTGAVTWATSTYVLRIVTVPGKDAMLVDTPTFFGGTMSTEVAWAEITRPRSYHPFATFEAAGRKYYLDELGEMHDSGFMERYAGRLPRSCLVTAVLGSHHSVHLCSLQVGGGAQLVRLS